ncbi:MAG: PilZ domain-containing protein [Erythrobacter sp.]
MKTRQTQRKTITLAGRYFAGLGSPVKVLINDLSPRGCRFAVDAPQPIRGSRVQLYLERSGPHHATVKWVKHGEIGVTFDAVLNDDLFRQFQNSHVPAAGEDRAPEAFVETPKGTPSRFC